MSLFQVFSEMTTHRNGFGQNSCVADEQACVFGSSEFNKHFVLKIFLNQWPKFPNCVIYKPTCIIWQEQALNQNRSVRL